MLITRNPACFGLALTAALLYGLTAWAGEQMVPQASTQGTIQSSPPLPTYELRHRHLSTLHHSENGDYDTEIAIVFADGHELLLTTYLYEVPALDARDIDFERKLDWGYVADREVGSWWLSGATNILVTNWKDVTGMRGTGHYTVQNYLLALVARDNCAPLLRKNIVSGANSQHANYGFGIGDHYFSYDRSRHEVLDRMEVMRSYHVPAGDYRPSLFHFFKSEVPEGPDQYVANIRETVNQRYRLNGRSLKSSGADLFYEAFANDSPREIAKFYFGPLAPASVIMKANSEWRKTFGNREGYSEGDFALPAGTQVRVALPEDWIKDFYR